MRSVTDAPEVAVRIKTDLAVSRYGQIVHRIRNARGFLRDGSLQITATFLCGNATINAVLLASADAHGGNDSICKECAIGIPGVLLYRCFDVHGQLLYVGVTCRYGGRMLDHQRSTPWWPQVARVGTEQFPSETAALAAERVAIQSERPVHNKQWAAS